VAETSSDRIKRGLSVCRKGGKGGGTFVFGGGGGFGGFFLQIRGLMFSGKGKPRRFGVEHAGGEDP